MKKEKYEMPSIHREELERLCKLFRKDFAKSSGKPQIYFSEIIEKYGENFAILCLQSLKRKYIPNIIFFASFLQRHPKQAVIEDFAMALYDTYFFHRFTRICAEEMVGDPEEVSGGMIYVVASLHSQFHTICNFLDSGPGGESLLRAFSSAFCEKFPNRFHRYESMKGGLEWINQ